MKLLLLAVVLLAGVWVGNIAIRGGKSQAVQVTGESQTIYQPVEQQTPGGFTQPDLSLWVVNNTGCPWGADDKSWARLTGTFSGAVSHSLCVISDWDERITSLTVCVTKQAQQLPPLRISIDFAPTGHHIETEQYISETKRSGCTQICMTTPDYDHQSPDLEPIPDSNGGVGVPTIVTFTAENLSGRRIRDFEMNAWIIYNSNRQQDSKCPTGHWIATTGECAGIDPRVCWSLPD